MTTPTLFSAARRGLLLAGAAGALAFAAPAVHAQAWTTEHWVGTWGAAPAGPPSPANTLKFHDQTLRLVVRTSVGGNRVRIRLSNEMGTTPLRIGAAHIAVRGNGSDIAPGTDRVLTFGGQAAITIAPGAPVLSDPVELAVAPRSELAVSVYLPGRSAAGTIHGTASQTSYVSLPGDFTGSATLPTDSTIRSWPFLTEVDVDSAGAAIVTLGDSITDGAHSTADTDNRWPDWLGRRLRDARGVRLGVVNRGINGNRLLSNPPEGSLAGRSVQERFDRDVLATAGVRYVTLMVGINDIGHSSDTPATAADIIAGYRQVIARAHAQDVLVYGATLTPFEGAKYYSAEKEAMRQQVNEWIRTSGEFDGVIDFDMALRDPGRPGRLLPAFDSGDHLHPGDRGYQAMGNAVPLSLFRAGAVAPLKQPATNR